MKQTIQALAAFSAGTLAAAKASSSLSHDQHHTRGGDISTISTNTSPSSSSSKTQHLSQRSAGRKLQSACSNCHVADANGDLGGPDIFTGKVCIFDKGAATSDANWNYSSALSNSGVTWTEETLDEWLKDPQGFVNGTAMQFQGITDPEERAQVIQSLKEACGVDDDASISGTTASATSEDNNDNNTNKEDISSATSFSAFNLTFLTAGMLAIVLGRK